MTKHINSFLGSMQAIKKETGILAEKERREQSYQGLVQHRGWKVFRESVAKQLKTLEKNARGVKDNETIELCLMRKLVVEGLADIINAMMSKVEQTADYYDNKEADEKRKKN